MKRLAFHDNHLGIRGTSVALYDYANHNEKILKNISIIVVPEESKESKETSPLAVTKFSNRFRVMYYKDLEDLERILDQEKIDIMYMIKYGKNDGVFSRKIKTVIHCVFDMTEPHGDVYAGVSRTIAEKHGRTTFVPHMIAMEEVKEVKGKSLREYFGIPENAVVFGRYGGRDTMNLLFAWRCILRIVQTYPNIYFLLGNTPECIRHPNIIYISPFCEDREKNLFIQTCDAHIECGLLGHSFGLAIAEFGMMNKPTIAYKGAWIDHSVDVSGYIWNDEHIKILKEKGIYYSNEKEFYHILTTFDPVESRKRDNFAHSAYTPEKVMKIFKEIFLD